MSDPRVKTPCHPERSEAPAQRTLREAEGPLFPLQLLASKAFEACKLAYAALREIFDESAYQRFLARHSLTSSTTAYKLFLREGEAAKARRPRCC